MSDSIKYISVKEFRELGLLQEINRQLLHPIGLALEGHLDTDLFRIQDHRDDLEGVIYEQKNLSEQKQRMVAALQKARWDARRGIIGCVIQPVVDAVIGRRVRMKAGDTGRDDDGSSYELRPGDRGRIHMVTSLRRYTIEWDTGKWTTWTVDKLNAMIDFLGQEDAGEGDQTP